MIYSSLLIILGFLIGYMTVRHMLKIEETQKKILDNHRGLVEWLEKVRKDNAELLNVLQAISSVQSSIVSSFERSKEQPKPVIKGIVKRRPNSYSRTPEFKKKMSEVTKARWEKKKAHGSWKIPEPDTIEKDRIPFTAPLIQKEVEG